MSAVPRAAFAALLVVAALAGAATTGALGGPARAARPAGARRAARPAGARHAARPAGAQRATRATRAARTARAADAAAVATKTTTSTSSSPSVSRFYISGAGFGHGVGMSQYGAAGFAAHGYTYAQILSHYYSGTTLGTLQPGRTVTVLLHEGAAAFRGATSIVGFSKQLLPGCTYRVIPHGSKLQIVRGAHVVGTFTAPVIVHDKGGLHGTGAPLTLVGQGAYDGVLIFRPDGTSGVMTVNSVNLGAYVRGVVPDEMPSNWPAQALEAQAVAARTYAITAPAVNPDFDLYDDTRSQVYGGFDSEKPTSNAAVAATSEKVVEYDGHPAVTYFFSSSGGYTESVQNVWSNLSPEPWLRGVPDPYDDTYDNPYYRWLSSYSLIAAAHKLRDLYKGAFVGIKVTRTGVSPRVTQALVVGTDGSGAVTGAQLQRLFATRSTYLSFTTLTEQAERTRTMTKTTRRVARTAGSTVKTTERVTIGLSLKGTVYPATVFGARRRLTVTAQREWEGHWRSKASAHPTVKGTYAILVKTPGTYRIVYDGLDGPNVKVP